MPKVSEELGPLAVSRLTAPGFHRVGGVPGLALQVTDTGARSWILRYTVGGKSRDMGLGGYPAVTLAAAREAARSARAKVRSGVDPIQEAKAAKSALLASRARDVTFQQCATEYIEKHESSWKNPKHRLQWSTTLETYVYPHFGKLFVRDVTLTHVLKALEPIWMTKTETATRIRSRIEAVMSSAIAKGYATGPNPARWKDGLKATLPAPQKIAKEEHHPAVPVEQIGEFMAALRKLEGTGARALEFLVLTASRSVEVRGARWSEFDFARKIWTVPAGRMKGGREHIVPLSAAALKIVQAQPRIAGEDHLFPSSRNGGALSDMAMAQQMRRMDFKDENGEVCVPHGLRSTFSDWCGDFLDLVPEVTEMALAHAIADKTRGAYRRRTAIEKRRRVMEQWARFCSKPYRPESGKVLKFAA